MSTVDSTEAAWRKSSYSSGNGQCIEVADGFPGVTPVRDSKESDGPNLVFEANAWTSFVEAVKTDGIGA
ncbi:DUF397 domain-containing protein [Streptomyces sp. AJS327]|uniref:DUF397 domain-containing protein n=1 Tax=Streptomyces sp. AJS327 TaxID=2545265 RepID=UPI0015DE4F64|nr:DUF397 domain-containing protein [Streptomyces sp. AJS327]MBA0053016.1 DUF397 domain-containing protein [Streptomyces sp. AJS327]